MLDLVKIQNEGAEIKVTHGQTVGHILNANEIHRKNSDEHWNNGSKTMQHVGCISEVAWVMLQAQGIANDPKEILRWLERNPEYKVTEKKLI